MHYPESVELIKQRTAAARVVIFDHTIRRRRPGQLDDSPDRQQPLAQAHLDQTPVSALARVHKHVPSAEMPTLLGKRFQILNLWRPIHHPAHDWPLALCDFRSFDPQDLLLVSLVYPDRAGETYGVKYNPAQRWVHFSGLEPEDAILIKCYDSLQDGSTALYGPHTAFCDPRTPVDAPLRESIELRALVFYS
uniref:Methyltransferase n=1 Tax=Mycena chlorophos TaxID=658473 RepID=A0ABQ0LT84_MYCCL|nr:predicted protein [Mycena chlorophos]